MTSVFNSGQFRLRGVDGDANLTNTGYNPATNADKRFANKQYGANGFTYLTHLDPRSEEFYNRIFTRNNNKPTKNSQMIQPRLTPYAALYFNQGGYTTQTRPPEVLEEELPDMVDTKYRQIMEQFLLAEEQGIPLPQEIDEATEVQRVRDNLRDAKERIEKQLPPNLSSDVKNQIIANFLLQQLTPQTTGQQAQQAPAVASNLPAQTTLNEQVSRNQALRNELFQRQREVSQAQAPVRIISPSTTPPLPTQPIMVIPSLAQIQASRSGLRPVSAGVITEQRATERQAQASPFMSELRQAVAQRGARATMTRTGQIIPATQILRAEEEISPQRVRELAQRARERMLEERAVRGVEAMADIAEQRRRRGEKRGAGARG